MRCSRSSGLVKAYPGVRALDGAGLTARAGTVHALVGENGAGKSTLWACLPATPSRTPGSCGSPASRCGSPTGAALAAGVSAVYQELTVLPAMRVIDNVLLGQELDAARAARGGVERRALAREALSRAGLDGLDLDTPAERLPLGTRQLAEIARASCGARAC